MPIICGYSSSDTNHLLSGDKDQIELTNNLLSKGLIKIYPKHRSIAFKYFSGSMNRSSVQ